MPPPPEPAVPTDLTPVEKPAGDERAQDEGAGNERAGKERSDDRRSARPEVSADPPPAAVSLDPTPSSDPSQVAPPKAGVRQLLPYLRPHRAVLGAVALLALVGSAAALTQPLLIRAVLDRTTKGQPVAQAVALLVVVLIGAAALGGLERYLLQRTGEAVVLDARTSLARHLIGLPVAEHDRRRTGDLLSRVGADTTLLRAVVTSGLVEAVSGVVIVIGAATAMALLDLTLLLVTLAALAVGIGLVLTVSRKVREASAAAQARVGDMSASVERAITAVRTIRAANAQGRETEAVGASARQAYEAGLRVARLQAVISPAAAVTVQGAAVLVLGLGGARVANGTLSVADLVAFVLYLFLLVLPLGQAISAWTTLQTGLGALGRVEEILALPLEPRGGTQLPRPDGSMVDLQDVHFSYGGAPVLRGVSFTVPRGTRTALVGPSGAGKSTVLALVERFYDVESGAVRVGGRDVRDLDVEALRASTGYVEQEAPALAGTIRDNLLLGRADATDQALGRVLASVGLTELVARAPEGLATEVGDGGVLLSGGERQRLAIARALLAAPALLLLDEPTSNLDARNEALLRRAIDTVATGRTLLVVAHRLSTVVDADQIVVMEEGRIVATGTHHELVVTSSLYRELASQQLLV